MEINESKQPDVTVNDLLNRLDAYSKLEDALASCVAKHCVDETVELGSAALQYRMAFLESKMYVDVDLEAYENDLKTAAGHNVGNELIRAAKEDVNDLLRDTFGKGQ